MSSDSIAKCGRRIGERRPGASLAQNVRAFMVKLVSDAFETSESAKCELCVRLYTLRILCYKYNRNTLESVSKMAIESDKKANLSTKTKH